MEVQAAVLVLLLQFLEVHPHLEVLQDQVLYLCHQYLEYLCQAHLCQEYLYLEYLYLVWFLCHL
jgi:hypothetical protein